MFYHHAGLSMIAWQATIKPKVRFISFQTKIQPSFTRAKAG